jgi:hypothetical protein
VAVTVSPAAVGGASPAWELACGSLYCPSDWVDGCSSPAVNKYAYILFSCIGVGCFSPRALDIVRAMSGFDRASRQRRIDSTALRGAKASLEKQFDEAARAAERSLVPPAGG